MDDPPGMAVVDPIDKLVEEQFQLIRADSMFMLRHVFLQIVIDEVKDEVKLLLGWDIANLSEPDNVGMGLKFLQNRYLSHGS